MAAPKKRDAEKNANPVEVGAIEEFGKMESIPEYDKTIPKSPQGFWITLHYFVGYSICLAIVLIFVLIIYRGGTVNDYLIGFVGSILGYFIAKAPYELQLK